MRIQVLEGTKKKNAASKAARLSIGFPFFFLLKTSNRNYRSNFFSVLWPFLINEKGGGTCRVTFDPREINLEKMDSTIFDLISDFCDGVVIVFSRSTRFKHERSRFQILLVFSSTFQIERWLIDNTAKRKAEPDAELNFQHTKNGQ